METQKRVGPLAQLIWDLATDPEFYTRFKNDEDVELQARGFDASRITRIKGAFTDDKVSLEGMLIEEEAALEAMFGPRPPGPQLITGWPPRRSRPSKPKAAEKEKKHAKS